MRTWGIVAGASVATMLVVSVVGSVLEARGPVSPSVMLDRLGDGEGSQDDVRIMQESLEILRRDIET